MVWLSLPDARILSACYHVPTAFPWASDSGLHACKASALLTAAFPASTLPVYTMGLNIHTFWCPYGPWDQFLSGTEEQLYLSDLTSGRYHGLQMKRSRLTLTLAKPYNWKVVAVFGLRTQICSPLHHSAFQEDEGLWALWEDAVSLCGTQATHSAAPKSPDSPST